MTEAALPLSPETFPQEKSTEARNFRGLAERAIGRAKSGVKAVRAAFGGLRHNPVVAAEEAELDDLLAESEGLTADVEATLGIDTVIKKEGKGKPWRRHKSALSRRGLQHPQDQLALATGDTHENRANAKESTEVALRSAREQGSDPETEIPYRREQIVAFAMNFLHTLNSATISAEEIHSFLADKDIFAGVPTEEVPPRMRVLRGFEDMFALAKYYDSNLDAVPRETIVMTDQQTVEPFDDKVLFYVEETEYATFSRSTLPRPKNDILRFEGEEEKKRPDVYIKSIDDMGIEEQKGARGKVKRTAAKKESFSITGCDAVIIGGKIRPDIPTVDISCNGTVTILPEASFTPAPPEGRTTISIATGSDIVLPEGSTLASSVMRCDNFRLEGGEIVNPHPNEKRVEILCKKMVDSNEKPLDPRLFHVNDDGYSARQDAIQDVVLRTKLGITDEQGRQLETMDRSEYVSEFAVKFLKALNPNADEDRIAMELFARGAPGTTDARLLYGNLDENIARWKAEEAKELEQRTLLFRGVEDMLRLVEYYKENPGVELPSEVFVLRGESEIPEEVKNNRRKTLIYWSEVWEQVEQYNMPKMQFLGRDIDGSIPWVALKEIRRPMDEEFIYEGDKKPDLFISQGKYPIIKGDLTLRGFDTVMVNATVQVSHPDIVCSGELKLFPNSSIEAFSDQSSISARDITQEGNLGVAEIRCNTFRRKQGDFTNPKREGTVTLVCEEYVGEPPDPEVVDLITSSVL